MIVSRISDQMKREILAAASIFAFYSVIRNFLPPSSVAFFVAMYIFILSVVYVISFSTFLDEEDETEESYRYEGGYFARQYYYHQILGLDQED